MKWLRGRARWWVVLTCGLGLAASIHGAQNPSDPAATLTSRAELVSVPVIVTDNFGSNVHGLKKEDFTVYEEGVEQPMSVFEEVQPANNAQPPNTLPTDQFSNMRDDAGNRQLTIVLIDMLNTPVPDQVFAKDQVVKYLTDPAHAGHPVSLLALNRTGVKLIHHFTRDSRELTKALNSVQRSQTPVTEDPSEAFLTNGTDKLSKIMQSFGEFQVA